MGVAELLEGKRTENPEAAENVELLVKKALSLAEENPERAKKERKKRALLFGGAALVSVLIYALGGWFLGRGGYGSGFPALLVYEVLGIVFGVYFWCFLKEKLPGYYDENRINFYGDGFLKINFPGVSFNNTNWPKVVKAFRLWSLVTVLTVPLLNIVLSLLPIEEEAYLACQMVTLGIFLGSLFLPVYLVAGREGRKPENKRKKWPVLIAAAAVCVLVLAVGGMGNMRSSLQVGYVSSSTPQGWTARYHLLTGIERHTLHPKQKAYMVTVVTEAGSLAMEFQDETGVVFSRTEMESGSYPVSLEGKTVVTVTAEGHKGSFTVAPEENP